jgi:trigger factor
MRTTVTELPDSRVRVDVGVEADSVEKSLERAARSLASDMRVPGFRRGKAPAGIVMQRLGREAVLEQAVRDSLGEWYERALADAGVTPIGDPKLEVGDLPGAGADLEFSVEVAVRPAATLGDYKGLEVGRASGEPPEEAIAAELDRLREAMASVNPADREAADGDLVVIDYAGTIDGELFDGGSANDLMVEVGSGRLLEEMESALRGAAAGAELDVDLSFPEDYGAEEVAGKDARFVVTVKEVREKVLPELDDEFASDASEFDTLDELRGAIAERLGEMVASQADTEFRRAAVAAAAENAKVDLPDEIVSARAEEMLDRFLHQLTHRGIEPATFMQMQPGGRDGMLAELRDDATANLRREATLAAIAEAENIEVSDDELIEAIGPGEGKNAPKRLLERLRSQGRDQMLREEVRMRKAADIVVESAKAIPLERAAAREKIWTPDKEEESKPESEGLWTPGDG